MAKNRRVRGTDPRKAYNALAKYFGLRARDAFLDPLKPSGDPKPDEKSSSDSKLDKFGVFADKIFSQGHAFDTLDELDKVLKDSGDQKEGIQKKISITTFDGSGFTDFYNKSGKDQGWGQPADKEFKLKDFYSSGFELPAGCKVAAIQVFPVATGIDVTDTEIVSLYLNSLTTLNMSRAIPYLDIRVINTAKIDKESGNFESDANFSLGKFLGPTTKDDGLRGKFEASDLQKDAPPGNATVAGMEIFTTPQTLVNRTGGTAYSREVGGRVDVFRPFLGIESLELTDSFTGAGTISYKSAELGLKLFDKGRLSEIADLVTPKRNPSLRFEITYGWSHPDGDHIGRAADADASTRLGRLIDSMRVTEIYGVTNSNFTIEPDGVVSINLQLFMESATAMGSRDIGSLNIGSKDKIGAITLTDLAKELEEIRDGLIELSGQPKRKVTLPVFVQQLSVGNALAIDKDTLKEFREFIDQIRKDSKGPLYLYGAKLYRIFNNGRKASDLTKLRKGRKAAAKAICDEFRTTPDPFLRPTFGVTTTELQRAPKASKASILKKEDKPTDKKPQKYVSYGKIMTKFLGDALTRGKKNTEVQIVFGALNAEAAGLFDHNIAQIPIQIKDFQSRLENLMATRPHVSVEFFIRFMNEEFIRFDGLEAYGLSDIIEPNKRDEDGNEVIKRKKKKIIEKAMDGNPGAMLKQQAIEDQMFNSIYGEGKRVNSRFVKPTINVRIVTKKAKGDDQKDVIRAYVSDTSAGRLMTVAEALMSLTKNGSTVYQDYSSGEPDSVRSCGHNDIYAKNFGELVEKGIVGDLSQEAKDNAKKALGDEKLDQKDIDRVMKKLDKTKVLKKLPGNLRKFFFEKSSYLLYGTEGSGIIEANLSSEANDTLTTIALTARAPKSSKTASGPPVNLPYRVHPTTLSMTSFGCPMIRLMQKYFVDMGTNTTADNYYTVVGCTHTFSEGNYTSALSLKPHDAYGSFVNVRNLGDKAFIDSVVAEEKRKQQAAALKAKQDAAAKRRNRQKSDEKKSKKAVKGVKKETKT